MSRSLKWRVAGCAAAMTSTLVLITGIPVGASTTGATLATPTSPGSPQTGLPAFASAPCPQVPDAVPQYASANCGYLTVPENHADPNGPTIRLAVAIVPAVSPHPSPIPVVYLHGGPGADAFTAALPDLIKAGVNQDHTLIVWDQRGTYFSEPRLMCPQTDAAVAASVGRVYDAPSTGQLYVNAANACKRQLTSQGIDLADFNTTQNAADLADLRKALGIKSWDVFGHSYGTQLALTYMREYPQGIQSVILDGVVPPSTQTPGAFWKSSQAINNMFAACTAQPACAANYPNLRHTFINEVKKLEAHPVTAEVTLQSGSKVKVVLDGGVLLNWLVTATHFPTVMAQQLTELADGNPQAIATTWATGKQNRSDTVGALAYGQFYSMVCSSWVPFSTASEDYQAGTSAWPQFPSSVLSQPPLVPFIREICGAWNVPKEPQSFRSVTRSDVPTLILNGSYDSQTAPSWGAYVAKTLPNSINLVFPGAAHSVYAESTCADGVITSFLDNPSSPNTSCLASVTPPLYNMGPGTPSS